MVKGFRPTVTVVAQIALGSPPSLHELGILQDYESEFKKTRVNVRTSREKAELLFSVRSKINEVWKPNTTHAPTQTQPLAH